MKIGVAGLFGRVVQGLHLLPIGKVASTMSCYSQSKSVLGALGVLPMEHCIGRLSMPLVE